MYKLATNLHIEKKGEDKFLKQPRTNQGVRIGEHLRALLPKILGEELPSTKEEVLRTHLMGYELLERGIVVPKETVDQTSYFNDLSPLKLVEQGFFNCKPSRVDKLKPEQKICFLGVPYDSGASKPGCRFGPAMLRDVSRAYGFRGSLFSLETRNEVDISEFSADLGDLFLERSSLDEHLGSLEKVYQGIPKGVIPFMVGGDHSFTLPALAGLCKDKAEDVTLVQFDSHLDLQVWGKFKNGIPLNLDQPLHSNFVSHLHSRIPKLKSIQLGIRHYQSIPAGKAKDVADYLNVIGTQITDQQCNSWSIEDLLDKLPKGERVYLTIDVDVLKSSDMGNTGYPNPTGISFDRLLTMARYVLKHNQVIGIDIMEFGQSSRRDEQRRECELITTLMVGLLEGMER